MQPTPIVRPSWLALHKKTLSGFVAMSTIGMLGFCYLDRKPPPPAKTIVQVVPSIVTVPITTPATPAPVVNVTVPPPPAPPEPPAAPPPRALTPFLDVPCFTRTDYDMEPEEKLARRCAWDDGFPAISADGKTIALRYSRDDAGRGWVNHAVQFIDVETSNVIGDHPIVAPDDLDPQGQATDKTRALATKRVAAIQKRLDTGRYRTMKVIPSSIPEPDLPAPQGLRMEHEERESPVRVVDGDSNTVLWRGEFDVATHVPLRDVDPDRCYPRTTNNVYAWFDPATRLIAFQVWYGTGPDYCGDEVQHYVRRAATL